MRTFVFIREKIRAEAEDANLMAIDFDDSLALVLKLIFTANPHCPQPTSPSAIQWRRV
jgi:hypothetical protein